MDAAMLERAVKAAHAVVAGISKDQLDDATPLTEWSVRDLLNHLIGEFDAVAAGAQGRKLDTSGEDYTADDHVTAYEAATAAANDALTAPGALERTFTMPWGDNPGEMLIGLMIAETTVHGSDLARATGQEIAIDDDVAEAVYRSTTGMMEPQGKFPRGTSFAPPVEVPDDAPIRDKMLAYLGRRP